MNRSGKFSKLFEQPVKREAEPSKEAAAPKVVTAKPETTNGQKKVGRPSGKRSNKDFQSVTLFLQKKNYAKAQDKLTAHNREKTPTDKRDVSTLVDYLLSRWLKDGGKVDF